MRLQVREAHFLEMIVVLALLNSLGKDRAFLYLALRDRAFLYLALLLHLLLRAIAMSIAHPTRKRSSSMLHELVGGAYWGESRFSCATE